MTHITTTVRNLKTLNINPVSYGALLIPVLTEKIPSDLRLIIARKFDNDIWDLETNVRIVHSKTDVDNDLFTTAAFRTETKVCVIYCREVHSPSNCGKVTDVNARRSLLRKYARCFMFEKRPCQHKL